MLKSLLLLCCAATIVSAGSFKDVNNTSIPANVTNSDIKSSLETAVTSNNNDTHMSILHEFNTDAKFDAITQLSKLISESKPSIISPTIIPIITNSTIKPITTSTTKPITTSTIPTTTSTTSTTPTTPSTTTALPITTTSVPPLPPPSIGNWTVRENNTLCIIINMAAQFNISHTNAKNVTIYKAIDVPKNANVTGKCGNIEQNVTLSWISQGDTIKNNFTLHFVKNETNKYYSLHHLEISLTSEEFPNDKSNKTVTVVHMTSLFSTGLSNSYRCFKEQALNLTLLGKNETVGHLKIFDVQFQAFRNDNTTIFGLAKDCSFNSPDIVPITVGCALAGLVVIVLIVYLVGRRRSQARGYLSIV